MIWRCGTCDYAHPLGICEYTHEGEWICPQCGGTVFEYFHMAFRDKPAEWMRVDMKTNKILGIIEIQTIINMPTFIEGIFIPSDT